MYLDYIICLRYTVLVRNRRYGPLSPEANRVCIGLATISVKPHLLPEMSAEADGSFMGTGADAIPRQTEIGRRGGGGWRGGGLYPMT